MSRADNLEDRKTWRQIVEEIRKKIMSVIGRPFLAGFATINAEGNPWVRYVVAVGSDDMTIRFSTFVKARKVEQIAANPEVHLTGGAVDLENWKHYVQIQGRAELTTDQAEKDAFWNDGIARIFKGPDDPDYGVIIVKPYRIEINTFGSMLPEIWEAE
jgi:general stress protein 26